MNEPEVFIKASGDTVTTKDRNVYKDLTAGLWNVSYGYNSHHFKDVISNQISKIQYYSNHFWSTTESAEKASDLITKHFNMSGVYFSSGGGEGIAAAIYMAEFCLPGKTIVLAHNSGYHGCSKGITYVEDIIENINQDTLAVIIEPVMTTAGVVKVDDDFLLHLAKMRSIYEFVIIFDETVTAFRSDIDHVIDPDIIICSKGLTNGLFPFAATLVNERIMHVIQNSPKPFHYGTTMSGHPIGCELMCRSIELYSKIDRKPIEDYFKNNIKLPFVNYGMLFGIKVSNGKEMRRQLKRKGFIVREGWNDNIILTPMYTIKTEDYKSFFSYLISLNNSMPNDLI